MLQGARPDDEMRVPIFPHPHFEKFWNGPSFCLWLLGDFIRPSGRRAAIPANVG